MQMEIDQSQANYAEQADAQPQQIEDQKKEYNKKRGFGNMVLLEILPFIMICVYSYLCQSYFAPFLFTCGLAILNDWIESYYGKVKDIPEAEIALNSEVQEKAYQKLINYKNYKRVIWVFLVALLALINILKIVYIILYSTDNDIVKTLNPNVANGLELYIYNGNKDNDTITYLKMFVPSGVMLIYAIVANFLIKKPTHLTFQDIIKNKPNQKVLVTAEIMCWVALVSVQVFQVSLYSYVFLTLQILNLVAFLLKDGKRVQIGNQQKVYISKTHIKIMTVLMWICKTLGHIYFFLNFLTATDTFQALQDNKFTYRWFGLNNVTDFIEQWEISPWQLLANFILLLMTYWTLDLLKYKSVHEKVKKNIEQQLIKEQRDNLQSRSKDEEQGLVGIQQGGSSQDSSQKRFTLDRKILRVTSIAFNIPAMIATYSTLIWSNFGEQALPVPDTQVYFYLGFQQVKYFWLDSIMINTVIFLNVFFIRQVQSSIKKNELLRKRKKGIKGRKKKTEEKKEVSWGEIFIAFMLKNSFVLALLFLYWISFYAVNLINLAMVLLLLIFFGNMSTQVEVKYFNKKKNEMQKRITNFNEKYWVILKTFLDIVIFARYLYYLQWGYSVQPESNEGQLLEFIGISYDYKFNIIPFGFKKLDFASENIFWTLYLFVILQSDAYKTKSYYKYSHKIIDTMATKKFVQKYMPRLKRFTFWFEIFFYTLLVWVSFVVISCIYMFMEFNFINSVLLICTYCCIVYYIISSRNNGKLNYPVFRFVWLSLNIIQILILIVRYLCQFTSLEYVQNHIVDKDSASFKDFQEYRQLIGFYKQVDSTEIRVLFLPGMIALFFGIVNFSHISFLSKGYQQHQDLKEEEVERFESRAMSRVSQISDLSGESIANYINFDNLQEKQQQEYYESYKNYVTTDILQELTWLNYPVNFICSIITHTNTLLVLIFCIYFRQSVTMLIFLIIYLYYYYKVNSIAFQEIQKSRTYILLNERIHQFKERYIFFKEIPEQKTEADELNLEKFKDIEKKELSNRIQTKQQVWLYSFYLSIFCIIVCYLSQFLTSKYICENHNQVSIDIQRYAFISGVQVTQQSVSVYDEPTDDEPTDDGEDGEDGEQVNKIINKQEKKKLQLDFKTIFNNDSDDYVFQDLINLYENQYKDFRNIFSFQKAQETHVQPLKIIDPLNNKNQDKLEYIEDPSIWNVVNQTWFYILLFWLNVVELRCQMYLKSELENFGKNKQNSRKNSSDDFTEQFGSRQASITDASDLQFAMKKSKLKMKKDDSKDTPFQEITEDDEEDVDSDEDLYDKFKDEQDVTLFEGFIYPMYDYEKFNGPNSEYQQEELDNIDPQKAHILMLIFNSKYQYMLCKIIFSTIIFMQRICVMILLFNSDIKVNVFSWVYMILALYFWVISNNQHTINTMNIQSIIVVLVQYVLLLFNINAESYPMFMPGYLYKPDTLSFVQKFFNLGNGTEATEWLTYFGFISANSTTFIINAGIVFFIAMFFSFFQIITEVIIKKTLEQQLITDLKHKMWINFQAWRSNSFIVLNSIYEGMISYGHVAVLLILCIISTYNYSIFNLVILIMNLLFLFYMEMVLKYPFEPKHLDILLKYFKILKIYLFCLLFFKATYKIPYIANLVLKLEEPVPFIYSQITDFEITDKIIMLFIITILNDIIGADDYTFIITKNKKNAINLGNMISKCMAFKDNDDKINMQLKKAKEHMMLKKEVQDASDQLKKWHNKITEQQRQQLGEELDRNEKDRQKRNIQYLKSPIQKSQQSLDSKSKIEDKSQVSENILGKSQELADVNQQQEQQDQNQKQFENKEDMDSSIDEYEAEKQKLIKKKKLEEEKDSKSKIQQEIEEYKKNVPMNGFKKVFCTIGKFFKNFLLFVFKSCESAKNPYMFLDDANVLNQYLSFNPEIVDQLLYEIEDFVNENGDNVDMVVTLMDEFYQKLYQDIIENGKIDQTIDLQQELQQYENDINYINIKKSEYEAKRIPDMLESGLERVKLADKQGVIYLYNVSQHQIYHPQLFSAEGLWFKTFKSLFQVILSYWTFMVFLFFVFYYFQNPGLMSMVLPFVLFCYFIIQEGMANYFIWKISFIYVCLLIIFKFILCLDGITYNGIQLFVEDGASPYDSFYDGGRSLFYEGWLFSMIFIQVSLLKRIGCYDKNYLERESVHQAYLRKKWNFTFEVDGNTLGESSDIKNTDLKISQSSLDSSQQIESVKIPKQQQDELQIRDSYSSMARKSEKQLKRQNTKNSLKKSYSKMYESSMTDKSNQSGQSKYAENKLSSQQKIHKQFEEDININTKLLDKERKIGFFQQFSDVYTKKVGVDLYPLIVVVQILILLYMFVFYPKMDPSSTGDIENVLSNNSIPGQMVVALLIQVVFIVLERWVTLKQNVLVPIKKDEKNKDEKEKKKTLNVIEENEEDEEDKNNEDEEEQKEDNEQDDDEDDDEEDDLHSKRVISSLNQSSGVDKQDFDLDLEEEKELDLSLEEDEGLVEIQEEEKALYKYDGITKEMWKFILMLVQMVIVWLFVFVYSPQPFVDNPTQSPGDKVMVIGTLGSFYKSSGYLTAFFILFCIYFTLSGIQLRLGYKKYKLRDNFFQSCNLINYGGVKAMKSLPFLPEIKMVMDWTFLETSLDLFQWFKLNEIQYFLYVSQWESADRRSKKPGEPVDKVMKIAMGSCQTIILLLLVFGPLLLFSNINPSQEPNSIVSGQMGVSLLVIQNPYGAVPQKNVYDLYQSFHITNLHDIPRDGEYWKQNKFNEIPILKQSKPFQFQQFDYTPYSDTDWILSQPAIEQIKSYIKEFIKNDKAGKEQTIEFQLQTEYKFEREQSQINSVGKSFVYPLEKDKVPQYLPSNLIYQLQKMLNECKAQPLALDNFYINVLTMTTDGDVTKPHLLQVRESDSNQLLYQQGVTLNLRCVDPEADGEDSKTQKYWTLSLGTDFKVGDKNLKGLDFDVYTDTFSKVTLGYSLITLYTSVILLIGTAIKGFYSGYLEYLMYMEIPYPEKFQKICNAIQVARLENNLIQENLFYYELIDIMRSPEILKMLGGSYADEQKKRLPDDHPQKIKTE